VNFYNEFDQKAAAWIRELIAMREIPDGVVDTRSITEIKPHELSGFTQCHFFAGVAGWSRALRIAGIPDDFPVWTGSCPCQPFSAAGKGLGTGDERHLWPVFYELIRACRPPIVFGEQVASAAIIGKAGAKSNAQFEQVWLDGLCADLEKAHYTCGAVDIPAAGVNAPHIRQRLYWVAHTTSEGRRRREQIRGGGHQEFGGSSATGGLGITNSAGWEQRRLAAETPGHGDTFEPTGCSSGLADSEHEQRQRLLLGRREESCENGEWETGKPSGSCEIDGVGDSKHQRFAGSQNGESGPREREDSESEWQRLWDGTEGASPVDGLADSNGEQAIPADKGRLHTKSGSGGSIIRLADMQQQGLEGHPGDGGNGDEPGWNGEETAGSASKGCAISSVADTESQGRFGNGREHSGSAEVIIGREEGERSIGKPEFEGLCPVVPTDFYSDFVILPCRDGKARRTESSIFPLVNGLPKGVVPSGDPSLSEVQATAEGRTMRLKGYGNAINPILAAEFILASLEAIAEGDIFQPDGRPDVLGMDDPAF
tara:strand:+ start:2752 stop:4374 length:1623 start_codon:yes stop_codon:yes gene_type:complete